MSSSIGMAMLGAVLSALVCSPLAGAQEEEALTGRLRTCFPNAARIGPAEGMPGAFEVLYDFDGKVQAEDWHLGEGWFVEQGKLRSRDCPSGSCAWIEVEPFAQADMALKARFNGTNDGHFLLSCSRPAEPDSGLQLCFAGYGNTRHVLRFHGRTVASAEGSVPEGGCTITLYRRGGTFGAAVDGRSLWEQPEYGTLISTAGFIGGWGGDNAYDDVRIVITPRPQEPLPADTPTDLDTVVHEAGRLGVVDVSRSPFARLRGLDLADVKWTRGFWADRFALVRDTVIPYQWEVLNDRVPNVPESHAMENLRIAAGESEGSFKGYVFQDSDVYKWLEACAFVYAADPDPALDARMDEVIDVIARAQEPDGYIHTSYSVPGRERFTNFHDHEMYTMGHLMQAACAHFRATGKKRFLEVACKAGDCLHRSFMAYRRDRARFPGHPEIEAGLVELYRTTGSDKYLELARVLVDRRGQAGGSEYDQSDVPIRAAREIVGHAVRAGYLMAGCTDLCLELEDPALREAVDRIWDNMARRKMYITGAVGARHSGEAFGEDYELPLERSYAETCAGIASAMWNWRMLLRTGDARYGDLMERCLYNCILSGIALDGKHYFYVNLHAARNPRPRPGWYSCACCPPNVARTLASANGYAYSTSDDGLWIHLYGGSEVKWKLENGATAGLTQETNYPWEGAVRFTLQTDRAEAFALCLRIPAWAEGAKIRVRGADTDLEARPGTYARVDGVWEPGDTVELELPMPVRLLAAHPRVRDAAGTLAVMRGPLVYCLEEADLPEGVRVEDVVLPATANLEPRWNPALLGGVTVLEGEALAAEGREQSDELYYPYRTAETRPVTIGMIPYYAWCNREPGDMRVHLPKH